MWEENSLPEHNDHGTLSVCHYHQGFPDHQCRTDDHAEVETLQQKLLRLFWIKVIPCGLSSFESHLLCQ
jgi:hypothetical protein